MKKNENKQGYYEDERVNLLVVYGESEHRDYQQDKGKVQLDGNAPCKPYSKRHFHGQHEDKFCFLNFR